MLSVAHRRTHVPRRRPTSGAVRWPLAGRTIALRAAGATLRVHAAISVATSLVGHTAVLAAMALLGGQGRVVWVSVQSGSASIALTASMAASPSQGEEDRREPDHTRFEPQREPKPPVLLALEDVAVTPVTRNAEQPSIPRAERPSEMPETVVQPRVPTALEQPVIHKQTAPSDKPDKAVRSMPQLPRADVGRRLADSVVPSTVSSIPSPGSVASRGAQSDLPAVVYNPAPDYPADALQARQTGRVLLGVKLADDGRVTQATVFRSSGIASFDEAALQAVRQWRFAEADVCASVREFIVPINFRIEDGQ